MILDVVYSINNVPIRLTDERWEHIVDARLFMSSYYELILDAIENPRYILQGHNKSKIAVVQVGREWLHVVYVEKSKDDGFILTAFTDDAIDRDLIIWNSENQE